MRAVIGSTFLIATLAGSLVAQAGSILHLNRDQSTGSGLPAESPDTSPTLADVTAALITLDTIAGAQAVLASAISAPQPDSTHFSSYFLESPEVPLPAALIAGGLPSLSAVLSGIHRRRPSILRL